VLVRPDPVPAVQPHSAEEEEEENLFAKKAGCQKLAERASAHQRWLPCTRCSGASDDAGRPASTTLQ